MCDHTHPGGLGPMSNRGNAQSVVCCARGPMSMDALISVTSSEMNGARGKCSWVYSRAVASAQLNKDYKME